MACTEQRPSLIGQRWPPRGGTRDDRVESIVYYIYINYNLHYIVCVCVCVCARARMHACVRACMYKNYNFHLIVSGSTTGRLLQSYIYIYGYMLHGRTRLHCSLGGRATGKGRATGGSVDSSGSVAPPALTQALGLCRAQRP